MDAAYAAFVAFGKGAAALNFGDVFSHAFAEVRGSPLLHKDEGNDSAKTEIASAISPCPVAQPRIDADQML